MRSRLTWLFGLAVICLGITNPAQADFMYQFGQSSYTINAGDTVNVDVFLRETGTSLLSTDGLVAGGVRINYSAGSAKVLSNADIAGNPGFDLVFPDTTQPSSAGLTELVFLNPTVFATGSGPPFEVLLGTFRFTAGTTGGTTVLEATNFDASGSFVQTGPPSSRFLDDPSNNLISGSRAEIVVNASGPTSVPEPASCVLLMVGIGSLLLSGRWHRRLG